MIKDVIVYDLIKHCDDRGYFSEIAKISGDFPVIAQISISKIYPGVIKAFHSHEKQWDLWYIISGNLQIALFDMRESSATYQQTQTIYVGEDNPRAIIIPPGVAHGYKVLGAGDAEILYIASEIYNPDHPDEIKMPYNSKIINYNWECQFR